MNGVIALSFHFETSIYPEGFLIMIITLFKSQIVLAEHECSTNWGDCKSNKSNQINQEILGKQNFSHSTL